MEWEGMDVPSVFIFEIGILASLLRCLHNVGASGIVMFNVHVGELPCFSSYDPDIDVKLLLCCSTFV